MRYYRVTGEDNGLCFYSDNAELLRHCPQCKLIVNRQEAAKSSVDAFTLRRRYNFSSCLDGEVVVSQAFVDVYRNHNLQGLSFTALPRAKGLYLLECTTEVKYDLSNPNLVRRQLCPTCGQYMEVSCVWPLRVLAEERLEPSTFYRTDLIVGGIVGRWPLILETAPIPQIFCDERMKGIYFRLCNKNGDSL